MAALTPEQEDVSHKIDTAGLALIGAGVAGEVLHRHAPTGGMISRAGAALHSAGPYLDLAGLAMIAPPVMHRLAKSIAPREIPVATTDPATNAPTIAAKEPEPELAQDSGDIVDVPAPGDGVATSPADLRRESAEYERAKEAAYVAGALRAHRLHFGDVAP